MDKVYELYLVVRITPDMLEGTTCEEIGKTIQNYAEKSGYCVDDVFVEEAQEE